MNKDGMNVEQALAAAQPQAGESVQEMSRRERSMLVFLRHRGCPFCREATADVAHAQAKIERSAKAVRAHQAPEDRVNTAFCDAARVGENLQVSDPLRNLDRATGLRRRSVRANCGPGVWNRSIRAMLPVRRLVRMIGENVQTPGVFVIERGRVAAEYRHSS